VPSGLTTTKRLSTWPKRALLTDHFGHHKVRSRQENSTGNQRRAFKGEKNLPVEQVSWDDCPAHGKVVVQVIAAG